MVTVEMGDEVLCGVVVKLVINALEVEPVVVVVIVIMLCVALVAGCLSTGSHGKAVCFSL